MNNRAYLSRVQRPSRYLGREINAVYKDPRAMTLRAVLIFPDLYEVGMSHLGLGILYDLLNRQEDIWAERAYAPAPDLEAELRSRSLPLTALESGAPLKDFDLVGVSLQYELSYTNLLTILELGGIPLPAEARGPLDPVVVGGGPGAMNPEPVAPFFDALVLGDGEEAILEVAAVIRDWRAARGTRQELWQALEAVEGVYVPALFPMVFDRQGRVVEVSPRGRRNRVVRRVLADLDEVPLSPRILVPFCQIVHDRLSLEISRGCTRGCRYCQAGMLYRPVRERRPEAVLSWVEEALAATGFEEVSLLSFSSGDYQPLPWLLKALMDRLEPRRVAVSLPSLRADTLTPDMVAQIRRVRRTGLTIAPEAGSQRLRTVINKNLSEEAILSSAREAFKGGWRLLKLYFMVGLPTETEDDLMAIADLVRNILRSGPQKCRPRLNVSLSTFIPKPHTPFQWEAQADLAESQRRLHQMKDLLKRRDVQVKWNSAVQSWLEGIFSRGDRRLAPVLVAAYRRGCRLDAWSEHLRLEPWREAFKEAGLDPEAYHRAREPEEILPWDHLDSGVSPAFLMEERRRAYSHQTTPDCRQEGCQGCGRCDEDHVTLRLAETPAVEIQPRIPASAPQNRPFWYRLIFAKVEEARWLSHLELVNAIYRGLCRSGLPLAFSAGHHPLPRVAFHGALPVGVESFCETMDIGLTANPGAAEVVRLLNRVLPVGLKVLTAVSLAGAPKPPRVTQTLYQVGSPQPVFTAAAAAEFLLRPDFSVIRRRPQGDRTVDLRRLVKTLTVLDERHLELRLHQEEKNNLKVVEVLQHIFQLTEVQIHALRIVKARVQ
ncbi:MAG: TIGR03960 family B12-binding radical SAM protein [Desulfobaccales bacterium]